MSEIGAYVPSEYLKLDYQIDAVKQCFAVLHNHGGFMLADVVGLGKTTEAIAKPGRDGVQRAVRSQ